MSKKIITAGQEAGFTHWRAPNVEMQVERREQNEAPLPEKTVVNENEKVREETKVPSLMTAEQLEALQQAAREEGFRQGYEEGFATGREAVEENIQTWRTLINSLARPFDELDEEVERELIALAVAMTRQMVRRELKTSPDEIMGVVRTALQELPSQSAQIKIELHPEDATLVRKAMPEGESDKQWQLVENPAISRGGCRVITQTSRIDATVETRLNRIVAAALGHARGAEST